MSNTVAQYHPTTAATAFAGSLGVRPPRVSPDTAPLVEADDAMPTLGCATKWLAIEMRSNGRVFLDFAAKSCPHQKKQVWACNLPHAEEASSRHTCARSMSDAPSVTPRAGGFQTTVTPPRAARVPAPLDPETPDSSPPNPSSVQNNAGHGQQPRGGFGEASSETPKFEDEEDGERGDGLVTEPQHVAETPANDVATVARLALHVQQPATWAESDADDDMEEPPVWRDPDDHEVTEPVGETDDEIPEEVDEIRDDDTNQDDRPARWAFLDLRGHHALDLYNEVRLVAFPGVCPESLVLFFEIYM